MTTTNTNSGSERVATREQAHVLNRLQDASRDIRAYAERAKSLCEEALRHLDEGFSINGCGVLQSTGRDLDLAAAMRYSYANTATMIGCSDESIELAAKGLGTYFFPID